VISEDLRGTDTCLQNFDVETFRYRSLWKRKLWLADDIKMYVIELAFLDVNGMELAQIRVQGRTSI
jgi:hypothetical protein